MNVSKPNLDMQKTQQSTLWVNYLKTAITILVLFHHSLLAYTSFAHFDTDVYINSTHPVVDEQRWIGLDLLVSFNDTYFMALMFLIGGLFLVRSIGKKGPKHFILDRFKRLFVPFLTLGTLFMLITYLTSYHLSTGNWNLKTYMIDFFTTQHWPVGPPWFIWLLFTFNLVFAVSYKQSVKLYSTIGMKIKQWGAHPVTIISCFIAITAILYIPISYKVGAHTWTGFGPFDFQLNRILLYAGYFWFGIVLGCADFNNSLFHSTSKLVQSWKLYWIAAVIAFILLIISPSLLQKLTTQFQMDQNVPIIVYHLIYVLSICTTSLAVMTSFKALVKTEHKIWYSFTENAYLMYLCHYPFVVWTQFFLLKFSMHASVKALLTFTISVALSWMFSVQIRRVKIIRKYL